MDEAPGAETSSPLTFGSLLRSYREIAGYSQEELAERAGISVHSVSNLERGAPHVPRPDTIRRLGIALGLSPDDGGRLLRASRRHTNREVSQPLPTVAHSVRSHPAPWRRPLPIPPTPLLGRSQELRAITTLLRRASVRLVTICGPAGVGKTHLSLIASQRMAPAFADGALFVSLAPLSDAALVLSTIAQTFGLAERAGEGVAEQLTAFLQNKHVLLILDNFEQVSSAAPAVADLLVACAGLRVLVTSRAALHLRAEHRFPLDPLILPTAEQLARPAELARNPAVALFKQRAQAIQPSFRLSADNAATVAAICAQLDGLPLAIELAAARVRHVLPDTLLAQLRRRLQVLTDGAVDLPGRQQTLRNALDWSYHLLSDEARALFRWLSVFRGGFDAEAVAAVCRLDGDASAPRLADITSLTDFYLLRPETPPGSASEHSPRFRMLATIREYAWEQLQASGESARIRRAHASYFVALAKDIEPRLVGSEQKLWLACLEREHDNLRAALRWALRYDEIEIGLRLAGSLWQFWYGRGHLTEGRQWLKDVLAAASTRTGSETSDAVERARSHVLDAAGVFAARQGDHQEAVLLYTESLALCRGLHDVRGSAAALVHLGTVALQQGDYEQATRYYSESLALQREIDNIPGIASMLTNLGNVAGARGDTATAITLFMESLELRRQIGNPQGIAITLYNLANALYDQGDLKQAAMLCDESLALYEELGDVRGKAEVLSTLAHMAFTLGECAQAATLYRQSLALCQSMRLQSGLARCLEGLAAIALDQGHAAFATRLYGAAASVHSEVGALLPKERDQRECVLTRLQQALGESTFATTWAEGAAMSQDQAVAEALRERVSARIRG